MYFNSPLRYPGGKNRLARFIALICEKNNIIGHYIEPYAGGASVALYLLLNGYVKEITINDLDRSVYAFWHSILNHNREFCNHVGDVEVSLENWYKFREIHQRKKQSPLFELGFATFFMNRTNHSGILNAGMIGGVEQNGEYTIDCRFNKEELIRRIRCIGRYKKQIHVHNLDALSLIEKIQHESDNQNTIFYFDPPYYRKGPSLYINHYEYDDHKKVASKIKKIKKSKWIVSYDNVSEIKKLYRNYNRKEYLLIHTAYNVRLGEEVLFFSDKLKIPRVSNPTKICA